MLGFLPFFILAGAAVSILVFRFVHRGTGYAWLYAVLCSSASWGITIFIKDRLPFTFEISGWSNIGISMKFPFIEINLINWPFVFIISSIVCAVIFSSSVRLGVVSNYREWAGILLIGSLGIVGSMAGNLLTLIMNLGVFDLIELAIFSLQEQNNTVDQKGFFYNHFWRFAGNVILLFGLANQYISNNSLDSWNDISSITIYIVLLGCIFRLGIVPFGTIPGNNKEKMNGIFAIRFLISLVLMLSVLYRLPVQIESSIWKTIILGYLFLVAINSSLKIFSGFANQEYVYWRLFLTSIFLAEYLFGFSSTGIYFLLSAIPLFLILFLDILDSRFLFAISIIAIFSFSGLPYTPNDTGLAGFTMAGTVPGYLFLIPCMVFFASILEKVISKQPIIHSNITERWLLVVSPIGIVITIVSIWIISYFWIGESSGFLISVQALIMTLGGTAIYSAKRFGIFAFLYPAINRYGKIMKYPWRIGQEFFKSSYIANIMQFPYKFLVGLFEGDGGILWTILCLVLVITIIRTLGYS